MSYIEKFKKENAFLREILCEASSDDFIMTQKHLSVSRKDGEYVLRYPNEYHLLTKLDVQTALRYFPQAEIHPAIAFLEDKIRKNERLIELNSQS